MTLRSKTIDAVIKDLKASGLSEHLFEVRTDNSCLLEIKFKAHPQYKFSLYEISKNEMSDGTLKSSFFRSEKEPFLHVVDKVNLFKTNECPGELALSMEKYEFSDLKKGLDRVSAWAKRVKEECKAPIIKSEELESVRKHYEEIILKTKHKPQNRFFSQSEVTELESKLTDLEAKLEAMYKDQEKDKAYIRKMKSDMSELQKGLKSLDKKTWRLNALNKFIDTLAVLNKAKKEWDKFKSNFSAFLENKSEESVELDEKGEASEVSN